MQLSSALHGNASTDPWVATRANRMLNCLPAFGDDLTALVDQIGLEVAASAAC